MIQYRFRGLHPGLAHAGMHLIPRLYDRRKKFSRGFHESFIVALAGDLTGI
jgi:hypothetical protein